MLAEITRFVNWVRRRNPQARTHKDYRYDLKQFVAVVGEEAQPPSPFKTSIDLSTSRSAGGSKPPPSTGAWPP